jgi:hypothetical protein
VSTPTLDADITLAELEAFERIGLANVCRKSFADFVKEFWDTMPAAGKLEANWHMEFLANELQRVAERVFAGEAKEHDLVINISPGTSKSSICSILFPAWVWTRMPEARFICASHTDNLVLDLATRCRKVIRSDKYQTLFGLELSDDRDAKGDYANTLGGERKACTVGGVSPTGRHAHFVIIDDPIDPQKAVSVVKLDTAARFIPDVLSTRVVSLALTPFILIMQRLHRTDPTYHMLEAAKKEGAMPVRHICLPATAEFPIEPPELVRYYHDGVMNPVRQSRAVLAIMRSRMSPYAFASQFGQSPTAAGSGLFKPEYFAKRCKAAPYVARRVRFWDRASTAGGGCATAGVLIAKDAEGIYYVEHVEYGHWEPIERNRRMRATAQRDRDRYGKQEPRIWVEREGGSSGRDAWLGVVRALDGFYVQEATVTGHKDVRAEPWSSQLAAGNVFLVEDGTWDVAGYVEEHVAFAPEGVGKRLGGMKDRVDGSSGAYNTLLGKQPVTGQFRILRPRSDNKTRVRIAVLTRERLAQCEIADRECLLVLFEEPEGVMCNGDLSARSGQSLVREMSGSGNVDVGAVDVGCLSPRGGVGDITPLQPPPHLLKLLDAPHTARFADLEPAELQDRWDEELPAYGRKPVDVVMSRDDGKRLWAYLLKRRPAPVTGVVFVANDEQDRRAMSCALAYCDVLGLPRSVVWSGDDDEKHDGKAANQYVFEMVKSTRSTVV